MVTNKNLDFVDYHHSLNKDRFKRSSASELLVKKLKNKLNLI